MGLARGTSGTRGYMTATRAAGTPVYMAPEQWEAGAALSSKVSLLRRHLPDADPSWVQWLAFL